ncbi:MAG: hypothetical protein IKE43_00950 [Coriobacteriales bacterium]|nr:hypothetical protein [Coriobacteriales bacterium]
MANNETAPFVDSVQDAETQNTVNINNALKRAALKDLKAAKRKQYAEENAEDAAFEASLRHEFLIAGEQRARERWDAAVEREMATIERNEAWAAARATAAQEKKALKKAKRELLKNHRSEDAKIEHQLRMERLQREDNDVREQALQNMQAAGEFAERHEAWNIARGSAAEARRKCLQSVRDMRATTSEQKIALKVLKEQKRHELNTHDDERKAALQEAMRLRALATNEYLELKRSNAAQDTIEAARRKEQELKAKEHELENRLRAERNKEHDAFSTWIREVDTDHALRIASLREEWNSKRGLKGHEAKIMKAADKKAAKVKKEAQNKAASQARHERNLLEEDYRTRMQQIDYDRESEIVALQEQYNLARENAAIQRKLAKAANKEPRAQALAAENHLHAQHRKEMLELEQAQFEMKNARARERAFTRCLDHDAAILNAESAFKAYEETSVN